MNRQKLIITGASGFLGRNLLKYLKDKINYNIIALTSRPTDLSNKFLNTEISFFHKDCIFEEKWQTQFNNAIIINCAYPRVSQGSEIADGLKYIQQLFEKSVDYKANAIINISSQSVYSSKRKNPAKETDEIFLENQYAVGKYAIELILESICRNSKTNFTNIRLASLIGVDFDQRIINRLIKNALEFGELSIKESNQKFGFLDVSDAAMMIIKMLSINSNNWRKIYNIGIDKSYTLIEIAHNISLNIKEILGKEIKVNIIKGNEFFNSSLDSTLFKNDFGQINYSSLNNTIKNIILNIQSKIV